MVTLAVQIPCYNEEKTLPLVLKDIPKKIKGIDKIILIVIDDGSTDKTSKIAKENSCIVIRNKKNMGLGYSFKEGVNKALELGADILVNTDGDNQYPGKYIPDLIKPVLEKKADIVIGDRQTSKIEHFSPTKKFFQKLGSLTVSFITRTKINDTVSGFRAYSKDSMIKLNITSRFSYVLDSIVQADKKGLKIKEIKIKTNKPTRKSRLFRNIFEHIFKSSSDLLRIYFTHESFKIFLLISTLFFIIGITLFLRFLIYYFSGSTGHIQSLVVSVGLIQTGFIFFALAIIGDISSKNRLLIEETLIEKRKEKYKK